MNPFRYSLAQIRKALIAAVPVVFICLMLVSVSPPVGFEAAVLALIPPVFGVIAVFGAKNHSAGDLQKALEALKASVLGIVTYWTQVPTSTNNKITTAIVLLSTVVGVYWSKNKAHSS